MIFRSRWIFRLSSAGRGSAGRGSAGRGSADEGEGSATLDFPVLVYVSSLAGDRRTAKNSRWTVDFLASKKVPFAVIDLSVQPHLRGRLVQQLAMHSSSPG